MGETTLLLVKIMGPIFAVVGLGIILNSQDLVKAYKDLKKEPFALFMSTLAMMAVGMSIVMKHFLWCSVPEVLVSIVGLAVLVKGITLALIPNAFTKFIDSILSPGLILFGGIIWLIGGAYFCYIGFVV